MKKLALVALLLAAPAFAVKTGAPAPNFTLKGADGKTYQLADFKDKHVVLEWLNHGCPYVKKQYKTKAMQRLQKEYTKKDVVWLSVISSAKGKQGFSTPDKAKRDTASSGAKPTAVLLDTNGKVGKAFNARTTPHMFVINPKGNLVYQGAIDDRATTDTDETPSKNYVQLALDASMKGKPVPYPTIPSYGCSVKY